MRNQNPLRNYLSPTLVLLPALIFALLLFLFRDHPQLRLSAHFPYLPWQFFVMAVFGLIGTAGGLLDWKFHRNPLNMKIPKKERDAEAAALGLGGLPMLALMWMAMMSAQPTDFLILIIIVLIYTVVMISYDEFVFHIKRCGKIETRYHRMLVFGNGVAWLAWFHFIYC